MTSRDRERDFPVTSIGRTSGSRLQQTTVPESHPLGLHPPSLTDSSSANSSGFTQKYRTYTPRVRGTPSPAVGSSQTTLPPTVTPGTLIHPPSPQHHQPAGGGDATSKLQLTNAKAEAQNIGLDTGNDGQSIGWAMLEKIVAESETGEVWAEVWNAITTGKATMLLPNEPLSSADKLTPELFKDHIAFCDPNSPSSSKSTPIVTLSGLRGTIHGNSITFTSTLHPSSPLFSPLKDSATRSTTLRKLPPLPISKSLHTGFPSYTIATSSTTLPLPPKPQAPKPPLPPRPSVRPIPGMGSSVNSASSTTSSHSRIPNPFASLFGNRPSTPTPAPPPPASAPPAATLAATASPTASLRSLEPPSSTSHDSHVTTEVEVMVIQKKIVRKDVGKIMNKCVRREVKASLSTSSLNANENTEVPEWVLDRVLEFCEPWLPFIRAPKTISSSVKLATASTGDKEEEWIINPIEVEHFDDTVDFMQDFYVQLEDYLRVELLGDTGRAGVEGKQEEKAVCSLFYDRLFAQPQTDDSSHDTALSNRIAALNLLDLTLEHLDIAVENESKGEVEEVVKACGSKLCKLDSARSPKEKARILVDAHQIVVDGLSKLPPVRLMSPEESKALKEQQSGLFKDQQETKGGAIAEPDGASATTTTTTASDDPTLVVSVSSPSGSSSAPAPTPDPPLSPLSLDTNSELPSASVSASETTSPTSNAPSSLHPPDSDKPHKPTPVSSDVLLPMLIFSTVKANPPHLVSHLLYLQRFRHRNASMNASGEGGGGEESFCLINMLAVAEFLENVDLAGLGLGVSSETSASDLTPIITRSTPTTPTLTPKSTSGASLLPEGERGGIQIPGASFFLRGKMEQQVDAIAGSANKVISGVVDSSFGILRSFLPQNQTQSHLDTDAAAMSVSVESSSGGVLGDGGTPTTAKPGQGGFGLLKRETGVFSIASIAASIPAISSRGSNKQQGEEGQQLIAVSSRPGSIRSFRSGKAVDGGEDEEDEGESEEDEDEEDEESEDEDEDGQSESGDETGSEEDGASESEQRDGGVDIPGIQVNSQHPYGASNSSVAKNASASAGSFGGDSRSIRSFESMLSDSKKRRQREKKLKKLAKESEKEKRKEKKKARAKERERERGKAGAGKNVSVSANKVSSAPRKSLTDRLASVGALAGTVKGSPPDSRRSSVVPLAAPVPIVPDSSSARQLSVHTRHGDSPISSRAASPALPLSRSTSPFPSQQRAPTLLSSSPLVIPTALPESLGNPSAITKTMSSSTVVASKFGPDEKGGMLPLPKKRFMEVNSVDELSIGEVRELLAEYRRLVEGVRELGGFGLE
ncbi:hypothetical protein NP233_g865 [Leucocoprinus birnbaumii]|uniref:VPS9 domain-containing protein n=1 Tax=Leucocoprinus birnbaumii TaxID=56174 RepID=A0AAD5W6A2_9AGAR|nr:hypothetical protein NP233_g865 [Leucocoprinus birnbaumii]